MFQQNTQWHPCFLLFTLPRWIYKSTSTYSDNEKSDKGSIKIHQTVYNSWLHSSKTKKQKYVYQLKVHITKQPQESWTLNLFLCILNILIMIDGKTRLKEEERILLHSFMVTLKLKKFILKPLLNVHRMLDHN